MESIPESFASIPKRELRGVTRTVDGNVGRITLPSEFRKELGIATGDEVEIFLVTGGMFIRPKQSQYQKGD